MIHSIPARFCAAVLLLSFAACGLALHRPAAHAAPAPLSVKVPPAIAPTAIPLTDLLSGTTYPSTLKGDQAGASFQKVDLVDTQGKPGTYLTKGETATVGGETFLVAYFAVPAPGQSAAAALAAPGATLRLAFINMRYVQAMLPRPTPAAAP